MHALRIFLRARGGATAVEYGLIAALIAVALIFSLTELGEMILDTFNKISDEIARAVGLD